MQMLVPAKLLGSCMTLGKLGSFSEKASLSVKQPLRSSFSKIQDYMVLRFCGNFGQDLFFPPLNRNVNHVSSRVRSECRQVFRMDCGEWMYLKSGVVLLGRTDPRSREHTRARSPEDHGGTGIKGRACLWESEATVRHPAPIMPGAVAESLRPRRTFCRLLICKQCIKLPTAD